MGKVGKPRQILVIQTALLGDAVYSAQFVNSLEPAKWERFILASELNFQLFTHICKAQVFKWKKTSLFDSVSIFSKLRTFHFDAIVHFSSSFRANFLASLLRYETLIESPSGITKSAFLENLANIFDIKLKLPYLPSQQVQSSSIPFKKYVCIFTGSSKKTKIYQNFSSIISYILNHSDINVIVIGELESDAETKITTQHPGRVLRFKPALDFPTLLSICENSTAIISCDSLGAHLARGFNKPLCILFCGTSDEVGFFSSYSKVLKLYPPKICCWPCSRGGLKSCPVGDYKCCKYELNVPVLTDFLGAA